MSKRLTNKEFIAKANIVHKNKYDYSDVNYYNSTTKVNIICPIHGKFSQVAYYHIQGSGCQNKRLLPFDFYLPENNIIIEYDGKQHFEPINFFGISNKKAKENFIKIKENDKIKNNYTRKNNINLYRISYNEDILKKLKKILNI